MKKKSTKRKPMPKPPRFYEQFVKKYPAVAKSYEAMGDAVHGLGPLDDRDRALIKLAISGSHLYSSAFKAHIRKAVASGLSRDEIEHLVLLFLPTVGFPTMMAAMGIVEEQLQSTEK
ncbi:MAG: carboxymuconolactone decarboxylase family protein [Cyclobacteriaceae bacterium]|jgi:alkylhydroperoxidase/carboxymuconolactone decarboxylase family protein YurZ|nr:MAG: carboxymuconolactone decarboxylase family protein [Cyclobacteriaceae bacterium]